MIDMFLYDTRDGPCALMLAWTSADSDEPVQPSFKLRNGAQSVA